jgi:tRNA-specific 2-thiouridylase
VSERWLVAMSGGVDSSVAAALVARAGHEAVGVTMDLGEGSSRGTSARGPISSDVIPRSAKKCCGLPDAEDARDVARTLGIRHYTANYRDEFRLAVIEPFVAEYAAGRTPIPCIACNRVLKFDLLLRRAEALGARGVATGHYARIAEAPDGGLGLFRPRDREKDQTYFLFDLPRATLARVAFPLGELEKSEVRALARELGLVTAEKPESQGICFIPDGDVRAALARLQPDSASAPAPGPITAPDGSELGTHSGAVGYTPGQRRGLGLSSGPWYVREVRPAENRIVVDRAEALASRSVRLRDTTWLDGAAPDGEVRAVVRHRHKSVSARVEAGADGSAELRFAEPVWAPAPGQAAVLYDAADERVLGGGWITGAGT